MMMMMMIYIYIFTREGRKVHSLKILHDGVIAADYDFFGQWDASTVTQTEKVCGPQERRC